MTIDYSKLIQAQDDGYDVEIYKNLKKDKGFVKKQFPFNKLSGMYIHGWNKETLPSKFTDNSEYLDMLESEASKAVPTIWNSIINLVDVFTPIECIRGNEYSCQHASVEYPHSWIVMAPLTDDPVVTVRNLYHEMIHWKFTTLGFGQGCTPEVFDMLHHDGEFVLNTIDELHHSIVNSYDDTAQAAVGHKASGRPISASIHAYGSFLGEAHVALRFVQYNPQKYYRWLGYAKKWGDRLDESLEALLLNAKTTQKGAQLLLGLYKWTKEYQLEYKNTLQTLSRVI